MTLWTAREKEVIGFLSSASITEIAEWLHARMHGLDGVGGGRDEAPRTLVAHIYRLLNHGLRSDIQLATLTTLARITHDPLTWTDEGGAELLLLADPILTDIPVNTANHAEIIELLARLAQPTAHKLKDRPATRLAATQALLTLDAKPVPRFWFQLYDDHGPLYAPLVVEALARNDLNALTKWLVERLPDTALEDALINLLPFMIHRYGSGATASALRELHGRLSQQTVHELEELASTFNLDVASETPLANVGAALAEALTTISQLLSSSTTTMNDTVRRHVASTLTKTRETLNDPRSISSDRRPDLWRKYVDCADHAILDGALLRAVLPELTHGIPPEVIAALVRHLIEDRGVPSEALREILGELPQATPREQIRRLSAFPEDLRGNLIVELSLIADDRALRDQLAQADTELLDQLIGPFKE